nr:hypothetical protein CFP56_66960 [Quercus suber]
MLWACDCSCNCLLTFNFALNAYYQSLEHLDGVLSGPWARGSSEVLALCKKWSAFRLSEGISGFFYPGSLYQQSRRRRVALFSCNVGCFRQGR